MAKGKRQQRARKSESSLYLAAELPEIIHLNHTKASGRRKNAKLVPATGEVQTEVKRVRVEPNQAVMEREELQHLVGLFQRLSEDFQGLQQKTGEFEELVQRVRETIGDTESKEVISLAMEPAQEEGQQVTGTEKAKNFLDVVEGILELVTTPGIAPMLGQLVTSLGK